MQITRIQIEEGFLNGFDLSPAQGLNVLIGARGTGKTSVIELIRYALAARNHTKEAELNSLSHARAVLQGGAITIEMSDGYGEVITVSRGADDEEPTKTASFTAPIVLSQTEIETVGLSESGRLALLDGFVAKRSEWNAEQANITGLVRSIFKELAALSAEINSLNEGRVTIPSLMDQIKVLEAERLRLQQGSTASNAKQTELTALNSQVTELAIKEEMVSRFKRSAGNWSQSLENLINEDLEAETWDHSDVPDPLADFRPSYLSALRAVQQAHSEFDTAWQLAETRQIEITNTKIELEKKSRSIRTELDALSQGSGAIARQIATAQTQLAQLQSREKLVEERKGRLMKLREKRNAMLDNLASIRSLRFEARERVARQISESLRPHITIEMERSAQYAEYSQAIANALRGSGMKYVELSAKIAEEISPRELIDFVESKDFNSLARILDIPAERAARLVGHLSDFGLAEIATSLVEDNVRMALLDGVGYKDIASLSAGQRCTVVLSIVLQHDERTLVIDQPEDHLDNAFITSTVIKALKDRKNTSQVILSTHNANIPVLGEADLVVELTSDGRNGFIQLCKPLEHPDSVEAISNVMEGGRDAFSRRANFYRENAA